MVENSSGKEKKSKLTSLKIRSAKSFQPSGRKFFSTPQVSPTLFLIKYKILIKKQLNKRYHRQTVKSKFSHENLLYHFIYMPSLFSSNKQNYDYP